MCKVLEKQEDNSGMQRTEERMNGGESLSHGKREVHRMLIGDEPIAYGILLGKESFENAN